MPTLSFAQNDNIPVPIATETTLVSLSPITTRVGQQIKFDSMAHLVVNVDVQPDYLIRIFFGLKRVTGTTSTVIASYSNWHSQTNSPESPSEIGTKYEMLPLTITWVDTPSPGTHIYSIFLHIGVVNNVYEMFVPITSLNAITFP
ncbi:hypothetical protein ACFVS2_11450 [Brevibacillus sp. NPDC058079]|uniref:hypothetical protein n=1 Tax=Brevibacillus sp. NPDC058079 TaxID=3346330 RepID=UPI0036E5890E